MNKQMGDSSRKLGNDKPSAKWDFHNPEKESSSRGFTADSKE